MTKNIPKDYNVVTDSKTAAKASKSPGLYSKGHSDRIRMPSYWAHHHYYYSCLVMVMTLERVAYQEIKHKNNIRMKFMSS